MADASLSQAVTAMLDDLDRTLANHKDLTRQRSAAKRRATDLTAAIRRLIPLLPAADRNEVSIRVSRNAAAFRGPSFGRMTKRTAAVNAFLRTWPHPTMTPADLTAHLVGLDLPPPDPRYAARALARKVKQGLLKRTAYGRYTLNC
ncbi:MAG: hypothetical protein AAGB15_01365 [Pseudomonadota bacterium]